MTSSPVFFIFNLAARLPLSVLHRLGSMVGWACYLLSGKFAARMRENLGYGLHGYPESEFRRVLKASIAETGKSLTETPWVWQRPLPEVCLSVRECHGLEHFEAAKTKGKGIIFLSPHLGCFEVAVQWTAQHMPITALYRPPKQAWLEPVMRGGRERGQVRMARTDVGGVRMLYKALKRGEAIGLLPDQVPGKGEGEWADFFGQPAYTMTLVGRLFASNEATILMTVAERLPAGEGYIIRFAPLPIASDLPFTTEMNKALESLVRTCPTQYLWSYNRYKAPAGSRD